MVSRSRESLSLDAACPDSSQRAKIIVLVLCTYVLRSDTSCPTFGGQREELGLDKIRENPSDLKGPFTEKEKLLLEIAEYKLQVKILQEALKKKRETE